MNDSSSKKVVYDMLALTLLHINAVAFMYLFTKARDFVGLLPVILLSFMFLAPAVLFPYFEKERMRKTQAFLDNDSPVDRIIDRGVKVVPQRSIIIAIGALIVFPLIIALTFSSWFWVCMSIVLVGVGLTIHLTLRRKEAIRVNAWNPDDDEDEIILEFSNEGFEIEIEDAEVNSAAFVDHT